MIQSRLFPRLALQVPLFLQHSIPTLPQFIPPHALSSPYTVPILLKGPLQNVFMLVLFLHSFLLAKFFQCLGGLLDALKRMT